jgi:hypothetical protein
MIGKGVGADRRNIQFPCGRSTQAPTSNVIEQARSPEDAAARVTLLVSAKLYLRVGFVALMQVSADDPRAR